ncbi:MAG: hypothetical protein HP491_15655 [Nitrospira sp.]|nr:hypothetical protein [Nitrospira sp.]
MPYYYFDSTALVKRYSMERGTRIVNKLLVKRGKVAILPTWSVTDFYSIMSTRAQGGLMTRDDCYSVLYKFEIESKQHALPAAAWRARHHSQHEPHRQLLGQCLCRKLLRNTQARARVPSALRNA